MSDTSFPSLADFIARNAISMSVEHADSNPNMTDESTSRMDHWKCILRNAKRQKMTVHFSMGSGHNGAEPQIADVLDSLASDASSVDNARGFEDWAADLGYDTDSRKAERTYKACERLAHKLRAFVGAEQYEALLYATERL